jgi:DUF1365 family protein
MLCVDLDRIGEATGKGRIFTHNRFGLTSLQDRDHGFRDGTPLRDYVEAALSRQGLTEYGAKILFVSTPRLLGYAFNPISFYFCYNANGTLGAVLHQVKNTFGDQIGYLMPVHGDRGLIRQSAPKRMHVSPFFDMQGGYRFALTRPDEKFTVSIQYGAEVKRMTATMILQSRSFSVASLLRLLVEMPLVPIKVITAIHWEALRLFVRGAKFHPLPAAPHETIIAGKSE